MSTELAAQHPSEVWQVLGGSLVVIGGLVGVLYNSLLTSQKASETDIDEVTKTVNLMNTKLSSYKSKVDSVILQITEIFARLKVLEDKVPAALADIQAMKETLSKMESRLVDGAKSFGLIREDIREFETRLESLLKEVEEKYSECYSSIDQLSIVVSGIQKDLNNLDKRCISRHPGEFKEK